MNVIGTFCISSIATVDPSFHLLTGSFKRKRWGLITIGLNRSSYNEELTIWAVKYGLQDMSFAGNIHRIEFFCNAHSKRGVTLVRLYLKGQSWFYDWQTLICPVKICTFCQKPLLKMFCQKVEFEFTSFHHRQKCFQVFQTRGVHAEEE